MTVVRFWLLLIVNASPFARERVGTSMSLNALKLEHNQIPPAIFIYFNVLL